jgi:hypothetical protein
MARHFQVVPIWSLQPPQLRQLLLDALPNGIVRWGQKVEVARSLPDGRHAVVVGQSNKKKMTVVGPKASTANAAW